MNNQQLAKLPIVDILSFPYDLWTMREPTLEERMANIEKTGCAAMFPVPGNFVKKLYSAIDVVEPCVVDAHHYFNLTSAIKEKLDNDMNLKFWRRAMPPQTPHAIAEYQKRYGCCNFIDVDKDINQHGATLTDGQYLFHGGVLFNNSLGTHTTIRPLSTTLDPNIAVNEAIFAGKAYDAGQLSLVALRVNNSMTKVFSYRIKGTTLGHELEVLFASGASVTIVAIKTIDASHKVTKVKEGSIVSDEKNVLFNLVCAEIS